MGMAEDGKFASGYEAIFGGKGGAKKAAAKPAEKAAAKPVGKKKPAGRKK